jgi:hypothetical protein
VEHPIAYIALSAPGTEEHNTLVPEAGICFVYAQLWDDAGEQIQANVPYKLRGINSGFSIEGTTNEEGIIRLDFLPDDCFEVECNGTAEVVEVYYMEDTDQDGAEPWFLRIRTED